MREGINSLEDLKKDRLKNQIHEEGNFYEWIDKNTGYRCRIIRHTPYGHWCGYVKLPGNYTQNWVGYDEIPVSVHGGVTWFGAITEVKDEIWVGFDCVHAGDLDPRNILVYDYLDYKFFDWETYKDKDYVINECRELAKQLKELEGC